MQAFARVSGGKWVREVYAPRSEVLLSCRSAVLGTVGLPLRVLLYGIPQRARPFRSLHFSMRWTRLTATILH